MIPVAEKQRGPRSLKRMALAVALRNITSITDLGEMAFADAKPILAHVENPHQLHLLEVNCPQLAAEPDQMAAIWSRLLTKKVPGWDHARGLSADARRALPWIDIYTAAKDAIDRDMAAATARLQQTMDGFNKAKKDNETQLVSSRALLRKLPGIGAKKRAGAGGGGGGGPGMPATLSFAGGSRTKMTSGQSVLRRARREAKEISKAAQLNSPPTHGGGGSGSGSGGASSQIRRPPEAMLHDYRVAHKPDMVTIRAPKRRTPAAVSAPALAPPDGLHAVTVGRGGIAGTGLGAGNAASEARLLALKGGLAATAAAAAATHAAYTPPVSINAPRKRPRLPSPAPPVDRRAAAASGVDDLFGDTPAPAPPPRPKRPRLTVEDLEGGSGGDSDGRAADADRQRRAGKKRPPPASTAAPAPAPAVVPPAVVPPPAGSPSRGPPPGGRKKVDIFMRPKKR